MKALRVLLYGFCNMSEFIFSPLVKEIVGVREVESIYTMDDLVNVDASRLVDVLVLNVMAIGFNMDNQLQRIKLQFPEAFIICIAAHPLSDYICIKIVKTGVDVLLANIDCTTEFKRATAAIQFRRRYYPPVLRQILDDHTFVGGRGYRFLTTREHAMLVMTLKGMTLKEIAREMALAETTVCTTRKNAFKKMGVRSLVDFVRIGYQYNMHKVEDSNYVM